MKKYNTMVLAGGGMKGFAMLGSLEFLYQKGILKNIKKYIGTSIGSVLSLMMIIGYRPTEVILYLIQSNNFKKFKIYNIMSGISGKGFVNYEYFNNVVSELILDKMEFIPTFQELYNVYPIDFEIITFNYSQQKEECLSKNTTPDLNILDALRMSSNVPFLFGHYKVGDSFYFDGFITNIFPIDKIDVKNDIVIGISTLQDRWKKETDDSKLTNLKIIWNLFFLPFFKLQRVSCKHYIDYCDVININSGLGSFFDININTKKILDFFSDGYFLTKESSFFSV